MKTIDHRELVDALRRVVAGETVISPEIEKMLKASPPVRPLTERQESILDSMTHGLTDADIALQQDLQDSQD